jgi:hypothetical protein
VSAADFFHCHVIQSEYAGEIKDFRGITFQITPGSSDCEPLKSKIEAACSTEQKYCFGFE